MRGLSEPGRRRDNRVRVRRYYAIVGTSPPRGDKKSDSTANDRQTEQAKTERHREWHIWHDRMDLASLNETSVEKARTQAQNTPGGGHVREQRQGGKHVQGYSVSTPSDRGEIQISSRSRAFDGTVDEKTIWGLEALASHPITFCE